MTKYWVTENELIEYQQNMFELTRLRTIVMKNKEGKNILSELMHNEELNKTIKDLPVSIKEQFKDRAIND